MNNLGYFVSSPLCNFHVVSQCYHFEPMYVPLCLVLRYLNVLKNYTDDYLFKKYSFVATFVPLYLTYQYPNTNLNQIPI